MLKAFISLVFAALFAVAPVFGQSSSYGGNPLVGKITNGAVYSPIVGTSIRAQVTGGVSGATQFQATSVAGYGDDFFNSTWRVRCVLGTNVTDGSLWDITDYNTNGTFTTQTADGNWATGDILEIQKAYTLDPYESGVAGSGIVGTISDTANSTTVSTTLTVPDWSDFNTTMFSAVGGNAQYAVRVLNVDAVDADTVLPGKWSALFSLTSAGVAVCRPALKTGNTGALLDPGDIVELVRLNEINPPATKTWTERAESGNTVTALFAGLVGKPAAFIPVGAIIRFRIDASTGAAPSAPVNSYVTGFTSATGTVTFSPAMTDVDVQDEFEISWSSLTDELFTIGPPATVTGTFPALTVPVYTSLQWIADSLRKTAPAVDTIRANRVWTVTAKGVPHASGGSKQIFTAYGQWKILNLTGRVTPALGATGNQVVKLLETSTGLTTNLALTTATGSSAWAVILTVQTDTLIALQSRTANAPYYVNPKAQGGNLTSGMPGTFLCTPDSLWSIRDSAQSTAGAGAITWTIRAEPLTAGGYILPGSDALP